MRTSWHPGVWRHRPFCEPLFACCYFCRAGVLLFGLLFLSSGFLSFFLSCFCVRLSRSASSFLTSFGAQTPTPLAVMSLGFASRVLLFLVGKESARSSALAVRCRLRLPSSLWRRGVWRMAGILRAASSCDGSHCCAAASLWRHDFVSNPHLALWCGLVG